MVPWDAGGARSWRKTRGLKGRLGDRTAGRQKGEGEGSNDFSCSGLPSRGRWCHRPGQGEERLALSRWESAELTG